MSEVSRWASACALIQRPVTQDEAYALHQAMALDCAWQYQKLSSYGDKLTNAYDFRPQQINLLNRLLPTDYDVATNFWLQRLNHIDKEKESDPHWKNSRARLSNIKLAKQLLQLWKQENPDTIKASCDTLNSLHNIKKIKHNVEQSLGQYSCENFPSNSQSNALQNTQQSPQETVHKNTPYIHLPFDWHDLEAQSQQQLLASGFGGQTKTLALQWDNATRLILSSLAGLLLFSLGCAMTSLIPQAAHFKTSIDSAQPKHGIYAIDEHGKPYIGTNKGHLAVSKALKNVHLEENQTAHITWQREIKPAQEKFNHNAKKAELWRLGTRQIPLKRDNDIVSSLVFIKEEPTDPAARELAALLLDSGTADQVLITKYLAKYQTKFKNWSHLPKAKEGKENKQQTQRLYIHVNKEALAYQKDYTRHLAYFTGSAAQLLNQLKNKPAGVINDLATVGFKVLANGAPYFSNLDRNEQSPIKLANGIQLMPIPAGQFEMGSNNGESDEKPIHTVTIAKPFGMSQTEITFAQYDAYAEATGNTKPKDSNWGRKTRPVINVSWDDAQGYVKWLSDTNQQGLQCRLPTEAEWEYAARADTTTEHYWGDKNGHDYANYDGTEGADKWGNET
ncbi:MAG TPA: formylglycine-generating enzyme family protein, partial [Leucothrix mucor]|nr:formylglycine-generating enzyme family protein [Leucothrix mucor]